MSDYEKLGLKEGASKEAVQTAYRIRLLRYQQLKDKTEEDEAAFKEIDEAYNRLCGYDIPLEEESHGKLKNFLYYNKEKLIIGAFVIVLLAVFAVQIMNNVTYDFSVAIVGDFKTKSDAISVDVEGNIEQLMKEKIYGLQNPLVTTYPRGSNILADSNYNTMQQKLILEMEFGDTGIDIMILDTENYEEFLGKDYFYAMDEFITVYEEGNTAIPEELLMKGADGKVYGIRLSGNDYIEKCNFTYNGDLIACIFTRSERKELAFSGIQALSLQFAPLPSETTDATPEATPSAVPETTPETTENAA